MCAIHLQRDLYEAGFKPNKQQHVVPILATALKDEANRTPQNGAANQSIDNQNRKKVCFLSSSINCLYDFLSKAICEF